MRLSSLAVTTEGLGLGLTAIKFWTRSEFKDANALERKVHPTRVPIEAKESVRWLENLKQSTELLGEPSRCFHLGDLGGYLARSKDPPPGNTVMIDSNGAGGNLFFPEDQIAHLIDQVLRNRHDRSRRVHVF